MSPLLFRPPALAQAPYSPCTPPHALQSVRRPEQGGVTRERDAQVHPIARVGSFETIADPTQSRPLKEMSTPPLLRTSAIHLCILVPSAVEYMSRTCFLLLSLSFTGLAHVLNRRRSFSRTTYRVIVLIVTFLTYAAFHATRKPPSIVKR